MRGAIALLVAAGTVAIAPVVAAKPVAPRCQVTVEDRASQPIVSKRIRATPAALEAELTQAMLALLAFASDANLDVTGPPLARYLRRGDTMVVDAALPVAKAPARARKGFRRARLPPGPVAVATHIGRLRDLPGVASCVRAWAMAQGRRARGPEWESYETNPLTTPDPSQQRAQVVLPLEP